MSELQVLALLESVLGSSYLLTNGEYQFFCPKCSHHKRKLQVNLQSGMSHCWVCNLSAHTILQLLKKVSAPQHILKEVASYITTKSLTYVGNTQLRNEIILPMEYKQLWIKSDDIIKKHAMKYLRQRNFNSIDILRYSIGYCSSGPYRNRIIIPSYDNEGKLNYFIARDIFPESRMKYKNPSVSKDIIAFDLFINWNKPIILCEGVFDAISIRNNAIPLLGKFLSNVLKTKLVKKKVKKIYIALDEDAKQDAVKLAKFLMDNGIDVYLIEMEGKDPSEIGFKEFWKLINNATKMNFSDLIRRQLYG